MGNNEPTLGEVIHPAAGGNLDTDPHGFSSSDETRPRLRSQPETLGSEDKLIHVLHVGGSSVSEESLPEGTNFVSQLQECNLLVLVNRVVLWRGCNVQAQQHQTVVTTSRAAVAPLLTEEQKLNILYLQESHSVWRSLTFSFQLDFVNVQLTFSYF